MNNESTSKLIHDLYKSTQELLRQAEERLKQSQEMEELFNKKDDNDEHR